MKLSEVSFLGSGAVRLVRTGSNGSGAAAVKDFELDAQAPGKAPATLKEFVHKHSPHTSAVTLTIPRTQVSVKFITLPSVQSQELRQMVEYEVTNLFPHKSEELVYDHALLEGDAPGYSRVMLIAAPRDAVRQACELVEDAGLIPGEVSVSTLALYNRFVRSRTLPAQYLLVSLEDSFVEIAFIRGARLEFTRGVSLDAAADTLAQALSAVETSAGVLSDLGDRIDLAVLSGSHGQLQELASRMKEAFDFPVEVDVELRPLSTEESGEKPRLEVNLLPGELHSRREKKARRKELLYLGIVVCVNLVFLTNVIYVRLKVKREYLRWLRGEISRVEQPASDLRKKAFSVQLLNSYRLSGKRTLALIFEVYRSAPAGITLNALDISHRKGSGAMTLSGQAQDPDAVLKFSDALKKSGLVSGADVHYIKKQKAPGQEQRVDFELIAAFGT